MIRLLPLLTASLLALPLVSGPAAAQQNLFAPRIIINDRAITYFEIQQRAAFLKLLGAGGDVEKLALDGLIEDRLRHQEAKRLGAKLNEEDLKKAMEEFAGRANVTAEEFVARIGAEGIAPETYRDFVSAGVIWREIVRAKFGPSTKVSETEIDREIEAEISRTQKTYAISELVIGVPPGREAEALAFAEELRANIRGEAEFAAAVAQYSASPSRNQQGRMPAIPAATMPQQLRGVVEGLRPGQVSPPLPLQGAVALFLLRGVSETKVSTGGVEVDYGRLHLPATAEGAAELARLRATAETCKDIYGLAPDLPEGQYVIETANMAALPAAVALELARLDQGETAVRQLGATTELLMLCARRPVKETPIDRNAVRSTILNRKLEAQSANYLATLRADAIIREP